MRSTSCLGVLAIVTMAVRLAFNAPNNNPASTTPRGRERPSRATVMASNPRVPMMLTVSCDG